MGPHVPSMQMGADTDGRVLVRRALVKSPAPSGP